MLGQVVCPVPFIQNTGEWKAAYEWPLPETRWTEFYLHKDGPLSEHEIFPDEMASTFKDTPEDHSSLTFVTPPMVENTEVCGPMVLNLYTSTTDTKVLWFMNLLEIDPAGNERVLTRGWLRGSQRRVDPEKSRPWQPYHPHDRREPLTPGENYEFNIEIIPTGVLFKAGSRFAVRIKAADKDDRPAEITVHHNNRYPSPLFVPITKGNRIWTFMSGGVLESDAH